MKKVDINSYETIIFDCDGVILNSNKIKTDSFKKTLEGYSTKSIERLVDYHISHGGISRYQKFEYFLKNIEKKKEYQADLELLLKKFKQNVISGLMCCEINENIKKLKKITKSRWLVSSGGDQEEIREIFKRRNIHELFELGIYGSPDTKFSHVEKLISDSIIVGPVLFIGDSKHDYDVAKNFGYDFLFMSNWSEFKGWKNMVAEEKFFLTNNLEDLLERI